MTGEAQEFTFLVERLERAVEEISVIATSETHARELLLEGGPGEDDEPEVNYREFDGELEITYRIIETPFGHGNQHPDFPMVNWRAVVANGSTLLGYDEWVRANRGY